MKLSLLFRPAGVLALAALVASCGSDARPPQKDPAGSPAAAPPRVASDTPAAARQPQPQPAGEAAYTGALPPLPVSNFPAARPPDVVNAVYEFAARRPDVLRYVPCFCGCERNGHVHNEHCFVAGREADGKPRWDAHGLG